MNPTQTPHRWRFFSAGGFDQVRLDTGADLAHLGELDQKLWGALSCPTQGLELDRQTLALIDTDKDAHIRAPELIAAIDWALARLKSPDTLIKGGPLELAEIDETSEDGQRVLASAQHVLESLGKAEATAIACEDTADSVRIFSGMSFNGDGVIQPEGLASDLQDAVKDIMTCLGSLPDRSGQTGVDQALVDRFFDEASALTTWRNAPDADPGLAPLGAATADAYQALEAVRAKIDDFFTRCRLAAFDPRAGELMNSAEETLKNLSSRPLSDSSSEVAALPMAYVSKGADLPLCSGINPAWQAAVSQLQQLVVTPLLGASEQLSAAQWEDLKARFAAYAAWLAARPSSPLEQLDAARVAALVASDCRARLSELIASDLARADQAAAIGEVDRLVRYTRDLAKLAHNFVAFTDFYTRRDKAIFQAGTLYLDGRSCELCVKVLDAGKHAALATLSGVYLAYCDCVRNGEKMTIAAAFTAGDADQLMVGRNGIFYDREGRDWDATINKIVDHPISIRQAFWSPYKKLIRLIAEQAQKFAAAKAKAADDMVANAVAETGKKIEAGSKPAPNAPAPAPFDAAKFAGIFAAVGLAVGAIGTALASVVTGFLGLKAWQMPLALLGLMLVISGPSMAMAFFKLRNRNLGPILDANGWAVNTRARINIPFGTALTHMAALPEGAERALTDPYAEKKTPWKAYLVLGAVGMGTAIYAARHFGLL
ncbi:MAG: hypothetical protein LWW81_00275 [Rhodocyclales bacterium]|nr:hypothetical protein [Rhodocyclales bacterium]